MCRHMYPKFREEGHVWRHVNWYDSGEDASHECDACGYPAVRYVHVLMRDGDELEYEVGCVCAGILIGDMDVAKDIERAGLRKRDWKARYLTQVEWPARPNEKGVFKTRWKGFTLYLHCGQRGGWRPGIKRSRVRGFPTWSDKWWDNRSKAEEQLFAALWKRLTM